MAAPRVSGMPGIPPSPSQPWSLARRCGGRVADPHPYVPCVVPPPSGGALQRHPLLVLVAVALVRHGVTGKRRRTGCRCPRADRPADAPTGRASSSSFAQSTCAGNVPKSTSVGAFVVSGRTGDVTPGRLMIEGKHFSVASGARPVAGVELVDVLPELGAHQVAVGEPEAHAAVADVLHRRLGVAARREDQVTADGACEPETAPAGVMPPGQGTLGSPPKSIFSWNVQRMSMKFVSVVVAPPTETAVASMRYSPHGWSLLSGHSAEDKPSKSLQRMLGPRGNTTAENIFALIQAYSAPKAAGPSAGECREESGVGGNYRCPPI